MILCVPLLFGGSKNSKNLNALFDRGTAYSCINEDRGDELETFTTLHTPMRLATASKHVFMEFSQRVTVDFYKDEIRLSDEFLVVPNLSEDVVIGATTMQKWRIKLDFENDTVVIDPEVAKLTLINL
jgi:hypothetical protein